MNVHVFLTCIYCIAITTKYSFICAIFSLLAVNYLMVVLHRQYSRLKFNKCEHFRIMKLFNECNKRMNIVTDYITDQITCLYTSYIYLYVYIYPQ